MRIILDIEEHIAGDVDYATWLVASCQKTLGYADCRVAESSEGFMERARGYLEERGITNAAVARDGFEHAIETMFVVAAGEAR